MREFTEDDIKMAEMAEEIQEKWLEHDTNGDYAVPRKTIEGYNGFWTLKAGEVYLVGNDGEYDLTITDASDIVETEAVWLPLEHQLWEMPDSRFSNRYPSVQAEKFGDYCHHLERKDKYKLSRWQLILMFVMHELYNKVWDSERKEWVKE